MEKQRVGNEELGMDSTPRSETWKAAQSLDSTLSASDPFSATTSSGVFGGTSTVAASFSTWGGTGAPTPCVWGYPALLLVEFDEQVGYTARWATEHIGHTFPENRTPARSGGTLPDEPALYGTLSLTDGVMLPTGGAAFAPHSNYSGVLDVKEHLHTTEADDEGSQDYHIDSFLCRGRTALTGTILRKIPDVDNIVNSATAEVPIDELRNGRRSGGSSSVATGHAIRNDPCPFLLYKFWVHDIQSRGGKVEYSFILVHDSFEELLSRQYKILQLFDSFRDFLQEVSQKRYDMEKQGGETSLHDQKAKRDRTERRSLAELIGPSPHMDFGLDGDEEDSNSGGSDGEGANDTDSIGTPMSTTVQPPFQREFTAPFDLSQMAGDRASPNSQNSSPNSSTPLPAGEVPVGGKPLDSSKQQCPKPRNCFSFTDYLVHITFEYILDRAFGSAWDLHKTRDPPASRLMDELVLHATSMHHQNNKDPWLPVRSLWSVVRPRTYALEVLVDSLHLRSTASEQLLPLLGALFRGHQLIVTTTDAVQETHDFALALAALLPPGLANVVIGSDTYRPSYECNILTFSQDFYRSHNVTDHRMYASELPQFVLVEEADQHSVRVHVGKNTAETLSPPPSSLSPPALEGDVGWGSGRRRTPTPPPQPVGPTGLVIKKIDSVDDLAREEHIEGFDEDRHRVVPMARPDQLHLVLVVLKECSDLLKMRSEGIDGHETDEVYKQLLEEAETRCCREVSMFAVAGRNYVECLQTCMQAKQHAARKTSHPEVPLPHHEASLWEKVKQKLKPHPQQQDSHPKATGTIAAGDSTSTNGDSQGVQPTVDDIARVARVFELPMEEHDVLLYLATKFHRDHR